MQPFGILIVFCGALAVARAGSIDFENLPGANIADFCGGGGATIGGFYTGSGVSNIGANVFGLTAACGQTGFPASSGSINVFSEDDFATISFTSLVSGVSLEYVSLGPIVLSAYDAANNLLGSTSGPADTDGTTGSNRLLMVNVANTSFVTIGNTGLADGYAFDDLSFTLQGTSAAPEPGTIVGAAAGLLVLIAGLRARSRAKRRAIIR